ncbi:MAG: tyrosine-type recombinase/integrase [Allosphingosinicella sp.]
MARRTEGWKLWNDDRTGLFYVRFSHAGQRHRVPTGERDPGAASSAAARIYAEVVSGRWATRRAVAASATMPFDEVAAIWLSDVESSLDPRTFKLYQNTYVGTHFAPFFETINRLTTVGAEDYIAARLRKVSRETLKKELSPLRRLARWAHARGYLPQLPEIETPGRRVLGTRVENARKNVSLVFTADEIARVLAHLPEFHRAPRAPDRYPVRARFVVAWETALRPQTLAQLRAPEDYRKGAEVLVIRDEIDKNRFGRELPISDAARAALDSVCPPAGLIFGRHDCTMLLRRAATAAGIDAYRAERISDYDFRHSAATHLGRTSDNLPGVMYLLGHKQPATTGRYMRPQKDAASEVLRAAANAAQFRSHSGHTEPSLPSPAPIIAQRQNPEPLEMIRGLPSVRGRGLEPRWLLTASTSN